MISLKLYQQAFLSFRGTSIFCYLPKSLTYLLFDLNLVNTNFLNLIHHKNGHVQRMFLIVNSSESSWMICSANYDTFLVYLVSCASKYSCSFSKEVLLEGIGFESQCFVDFNCDFV